MPTPALTRFLKDRAASLHRDGWGLRYRWPMEHSWGHWALELPRTDVTKLIHSETGETIKIDGTRTASRILDDAWNAGVPEEDRGFLQNALKDLSARRDIADLFEHAAEEAKLTHIEKRRREFERLGLVKTVPA